MFSLGMQFGLGFMSAVIIVNLLDDIWEWFNQRRKAKRKSIDKRYYLISHIGINRTGDWVVGHSLVDAISPSLPKFAESLQKEHGLKNPATILCLKDLTEEEYLMLSGKQDGN